MVADAAYSLYMLIPNILTLKCGVAAAEAEVVAAANMATLAEPAHM